MSSSNKKRKQLLIVEDDPGLQKQLKWCFSDYDVFVASDSKGALDELRQHKPPVVTLDLGLAPDPANASQGLMILEQIYSIAPETKVIVVTGNDDKEHALKAVELGAYDFYQKPIEPEILSLIVDRAYRLYDLEQENKQLAESRQENPLYGFIGASSQINQICRTIEKIAPTDVTTLLLGESGTGKELLAKALHRLSPRKDNAFIAINCAAIPENLLESELFGYEKGSYTGAQKQTLGKIEYANDGTLFLDEIGDLSQALQAKLLRFMQERVIERIGGRKEIPVDVRVICATHQDLEKKTKSEQFREDLYYRISEISIKIPPLRERAGDTVMIAKHFLDLYGSEQGKTFRFSEGALRAIETYDWPGNARELENKVKRATIMAESELIEAQDLELSDNENDTTQLNLKHAKEATEKEVVVRALNHSNGKLTLAAELLGVSRPTLYNLLEKYDLKTQST